jgi:hypothetical protein
MIDWQHILDALFPIDPGLATIVAASVASYAAWRVASQQIVLLDHQNRIAIISIQIELSKRRLEYFYKLSKIIRRPDRYDKLGTANFEFFELTEECRALFGVEVNNLLAATLSAFDATIDAHFDLKENNSQENKRSLTERNRSLIKLTDTLFKSIRKEMKIIDDFNKLQSLFQKNL